MEKPQWQSYRKSTGHIETPAGFQNTCRCIAGALEQATNGQAAIPLQLYRRSKAFADDVEKTVASGRYGHEFTRESLHSAAQSAEEALQKIPESTEQLRTIRDGCSAEIRRIRTMAERMLASKQPLHHRPSQTRSHSSDSWLDA